MTTRRHSIFFSDADWSQIEQLAVDLGINSSSTLVRLAVALYAAQHGITLEGVPSWGGGAERARDLEQFED